MFVGGLCYARDSSRKEMKILAKKHDKMAKNQGGISNKLNETEFHHMKFDIATHFEMAIQQINPRSGICTTDNRQQDRTLIANQIKSGPFLLGPLIIIKLNLPQKILNQISSE